MENAYSRPFFGCFGAKMGENGNLVYFYPSTQRRNEGAEEAAAPGRSSVGGAKRRQ